MSRESNEQTITVRHVPLPFTESLNLAFAHSPGDVTLPRFICKIPIHSLGYTLSFNRHTHNNSNSITAAAIT